MRRPTSGQMGRLGAGAILLLLCAFCFPSTASASCGDHVVSSPVARGAMPGDVGIPASEPTPANLPCSGPHCSGNRHPSPPVTAVLGSPDLDPLITLGGVLLPHGPRLTSRLVDPAGGHPTRQTLSVYRPPRGLAI